MSASANSRHGLQYNLIADSKTGSIVGNTTGDGIEATVFNNFYTRTSHRFPNPAGGGRHDVINNLVYNWRNRLVNVHNAGLVNHINNANVAGPATRDDTASDRDGYTNLEEFLNLVDG